MKLPSILTTISRYLKQRELNRTYERLAELGALIDGLINRAGYRNGTNGTIVHDVIHWQGERAKLVVRRDRLEKELGLVKAGD